MEGSARCILSPASLPYPRSPTGPIASELARVPARFSGMGGVVPALMRGLTDLDLAQVFAAHLYEVRLADWARGRVVLLGDAAHAVLPSAGMGASLALEDAQVLAEEVAAMQETTADDLAAALRRYVARRHARVARIQREAHYESRLVLLPSPRLAHAALLALVRMLPRVDALTLRETTRLLATAP